MKSCMKSNHQALREIMKCVQRSRSSKIKLRGWEMTSGPDLNWLFSSTGLLSRSGTMMVVLIAQRVHNRWITVLIAVSMRKRQLAISLWVFKFVMPLDPCGLLPMMSGPRRSLELLTKQKSLITSWNSMATNWDKKQNHTFIRNTGWE